MMEGSGRCVMPDWESKFNEADARAKEMYMKLRDTEEKAMCLHEELLRYKTIVKTMEFVLGRKFEE